MQSKADLHVHTCYSIDSMASIKKIVNNAIKQDIKILAITDHDTIEGALKTQEYVKQNNLPLQVIVGEEVSSRSGHVIGLFLKELVPAFLPLEETINRIKQQGGLVIIPHLTFHKKTPDIPFKFYVNYTELTDHPKILEKVDAIEAVNFTLFKSNFTKKVHEHADLFKKAFVGGSDAHIPSHVGIGHTTFPGETIEDLRLAILLKKTKEHQIRDFNFWDLITHHTSVIKIPFAFIYYTLNRWYKRLFKRQIKSNKV